jgi:hypothetical protein
VAAGVPPGEALGSTGGGLLPPHAIAPAIIPATAESASVLPRFMGRTYAKATAFTLIASSP